jgi:hypothetical protein
MLCLNKVGVIHNYILIIPEMDHLDYEEENSGQQLVYMLVKRLQKNCPKKNLFYLN